MALIDGKKLGKAAFAKVVAIESGTTTTTDPKVIPMAQSLGIGFDTNNAVTSNTTTDRLTSLETDTHTHSNKPVLDATTEAFTTVQLNQIAAIATALGITFNGDGTINVNGYAAHTHSYLDNDGTTDTARTTGGVS